MILFYCEKCGMRVPDADLQSGAAGQLDDVRAICVRCGGRKATGFHAKRSSGAATVPSSAAPRAANPPGTHTQAPAASASSKLAIWGAVTVGGLLLILAIVFASTRGDGTRKTAAAPSTPTSSQRPSVPLPLPAGQQNPTPLPSPDNRAVQVPAPTPPSPGGVTTGETTTGEAKPDGDYDPRAFVATSKLNAAKSYFEKNPNDPWGYNDQLEDLKTGYRGTPAADEADKIQKTLVLTGERPLVHMNWHMDWNCETPHRENDNWTFDRSWDGRNFVLHTHPKESGKPSIFSRTLKVPEDRPYLLIKTRGHDNGDFRCRVEVDGNEVLSEIVGGRTWRTFCIDLTVQKGREARVRIIHENTGWNCEHGHWQSPDFAAQKPNGAKLFAAGAATDVPSSPVATNVDQGKATGAADPAQVASAPVQVNAYAVFLDQFLQALSKQAWDAARSKLQSAAKDPALVDRAALLKLDAECVALAEKVPLSEAKGAALLKDGREFTLLTIDGKRYDVGTDHKAQVLNTSASELEIKQNVGGGSMIFKLAFSVMASTTRYQLAQAGLEAEAEGKLAQAAYRLVLLNRNAQPANVKAVNDLLAAAARLGAPENQVNHLKTWLAFKARDDEARAALAALEIVMGMTAFQPAKDALAAFKKDFADTAVFAAASATFPAIGEAYVRTRPPARFVGRLLEGPERSALHGTACSGRHQDHQLERRGLTRQAFPSRLVQPPLRRSTAHRQGRPLHVLPGRR